jgi:hypothetical protein
VNERGDFFKYQKNCKKLNLTANADFGRKNPGAIVYASTHTIINLLDLYSVGISPLPMSCSRGVLTGNSSKPSPIRL